MSQLRELLRLAAPLIAAQIGNQMMTLVDTAMVGRLGSTALAGVGIGGGLFFTITLLGFGIVLGMDAPVSQAVGAQELGRARRLLWNGFYVAIIATLPLSVAVAFSPAILEPAGVQHEIARIAREYLWGRVPNVLPFLLFAVLRSYLQAIHVTRPMIVATVLGNVANAVGNALLIWGDKALLYVHLPAVGLPALGALGSALSSSISSFIMCVPLYLAVLGVETPADPERRRFDRGLAGTILKLGVPVGFTILAEVGVFTIVNVLTGQLGPAVSAGHQIAIQLASFSFTITLGIATATSVLVGHAIGRGDTPGARRAGLDGLKASLMVMSTSLLAFLLVPGLVARILTDDHDVVVAAIPLIQIAGLFQLSDGTQSTMAGALRGAGDTRAPLLANIVGHYAVGLPIALAFAFLGKMGAVGLWWGLSAGLTAVAIGLVLRFLVLTSRKIERV
jgi:MATE family multidrug resistance protein